MNTHPAFDSIIIYAARYSYSRNTGAAFQVVSYIKSNWDNLSRATQIQLQREIRKEAAYDHTEWGTVLKLEPKKT